jgi:hypothetical protein
MKRAKMSTLYAGSRAADPIIVQDAFTEKGDMVPYSLACGHTVSKPWLQQVSVLSCTGVQVICERSVSLSDMATQECSQL